MEDLSLDDWMEALVSSANELATESLSYEDGVITSTSSELPHMESSSCVALAGSEESLQLGIAASSKDCVQLARAFCCMEPEDEELEKQDVADALGEMVNVLAGGVKTRIAARAESMCIGLPMVVWGSIQVPKSTQVAVTSIKWNNAEAQLWLLHHKKSC